MDRQQVCSAGLKGWPMPARATDDTVAWGDRAIGGTGIPQDRDVSRSSDYPGIRQGQGHDRNGLTWPTRRRLRQSAKGKDVT